MRPSSSPEARHARFGVECSLVKASDVTGLFRLMVVSHWKSREASSGASVKDDEAVAHILIVLSRPAVAKQGRWPTGDQLQSRIIRVCAFALE